VAGSGPGLWEYIRDLPSLPVALNQCDPTASTGPLGGRTSAAACKRLVTELCDL